MTNIIHLSDLHFGTENEKTVDTLIATVNSINPDVIVISGDFTQRAKIRQFKAAKKFLDALSCKHILCVPGNHDIPLHNLLMRFFLPFTKYKKYITDNFNPSYRDKNLAILGINSATPYRIMDGLITKEQLNVVRDFFHNISPETTKVVVMHHNMIKPEYHKVIINLEEVLRTFSQCKVNLILSGHLHDACIEKIEREHIDYNMFTITAGTALSNRLRTQPNSFNLIKVAGNKLIISVYDLKDDNYVAGEDKIFSL